MNQQLIYSGVLCSIIVRGDYEYLILEKHYVFMEIATLHAFYAIGKYHTPQGITTLSIQANYSV